MPAPLRVPIRAVGALVSILAPAVCAQESEATPPAYGWQVQQKDLLGQPIAWTPDDDVVYATFEWNDSPHTDAWQALGPARAHRSLVAKPWWWGLSMGRSTVNAYVASSGWTGFSDESRIDGVVASSTDVRDSTPPPGFASLPQEFDPFESTSPVYPSLYFSAYQVEVWRYLPDPEGRAEPRLAYSYEMGTPVVTNPSGLPANRISVEVEEHGPGPAVLPGDGGMGVATGDVTYRLAASNHGAVSLIEAHYSESLSLATSGQKLRQLGSIGLGASVPLVPGISGGLSFSLPVTIPHEGGGSEIEAAIGSELPPQPPLSSSGELTCNYYHRVVQGDGRSFAHANGAAQFTPGYSTPTQEVTPKWHGSLVRTSIDFRVEFTTVERRSSVELGSPSAPPTGDGEAPGAGEETNGPAKPSRPTTPAGRTPSQATTTGPGPGRG